MCINIYKRVSLLISGLEALIARHQAFAVKVSLGAFGGKTPTLESNSSWHRAILSGSLWLSTLGLLTWRLWAFRWIRCVGKVLTFGFSRGLLPPSQSIGISLARLLRYGFHRPQFFKNSSIDETCVALSHTDMDSTHRKTEYLGSHRMTSIRNSQRQSSGYLMTIRISHVAAILISHLTSIWISHPAFIRFSGRWLISHINAVCTAHIDSGFNITPHRAL